MNGTGDERPGAREDARPADAARRALRAAREGERVGGEDGGGAPRADGAGVTVPESGVQPATRPGDAAREALRRANAERRSGEGTVAGAVPPTESKEAYPSVAGNAGAAYGPASGPASGPGGESTPAVRPGDAARKALHAAREEVERQRTEAEGKAAGEPRPSGASQRSGTRESTGVGGRRDLHIRTPARGGRVRDVREVLAGAFGLPEPVAPRGAVATTARHDGEEAARDVGREREQPEPPRSPRELPLATPRYPGSMAAPGRDGELRRTFAALPARPADRADRFAETWWGNAWVTALEEGALDAARLARGRTYAGRGNVDAITVTPGLVLAYVQGSRPRPYRVQVRLRTFADDEWDRLLDAAAERPGDIAALLDKEVPQTLAECGVRLLPGPGDLEPHCSCPDFGHPCKHAAAVCYQTARLLDRDPFVLLLLRGRGERELLDALSRRNAARAARAAQEKEPAPVPGIRARDAMARDALPPLPAPLPPPAHPEQPPVYPGTPGGPDPFALDQLATDAAGRAHALLTTGHDPVAELTLWQDAVRLAAARPGSGLTATTRALYSALADATGRTPADLARGVVAWRQGGREALAVLEEPWDPPAGRFDRARPLLLAADLPAFRPWRNRLTHPDGHAQLRLGRDGLWYAYESEPGREDWWPRGTPDLDPVGALTGLEAPGEG
ncbi:SWIM zinc finger family protein [Streptomyces yaanensis]|uniref:SWIM zinc finger family protein n=1 Tax=Streptomyces yaanensis TaxID=1142239 RepID=A0ABV7SCV0_9ACTN|nr:SWIM zinc finger family protein [Streptomyces sp. CGMCC 4.7035]WNB98726.1 SWIM zinc finger family protein [Streptomyces sp. CGMCC 4.7035]